MRLQKSCAVNIVMLGCGGTGGYIAPHLYRLLYAWDRPARFLLADADIVEEKNLVRQNFVHADLGRNKAQVLAERYSCAFGMTAEYFPQYVENVDTLARLLALNINPSLNILIGAVDNNQSRKLCHEIFMTQRDLIYIDSGNGEFSGQVVCGIRRKNRTYYKPLAVLFPNVLEETDKFPSELSCAEAAISAPQAITANLTAATTVLNMLYNILAIGELHVRMVTFSTQSIHVHPVLAKTRKGVA